MGLYKTKPFTVEAWQFTEFPQRGVVVSTMTGDYVCRGPRGAVKIEIGDWVIREPDGNGYYPCRDEVFREKYTPVVTLDAS